MPKSWLRVAHGGSRDLNSANGLFASGRRFERCQLVGAITIRLGIEGPEVSFKADPPPREEGPPSDTDAVVARFIDHYFGKGGTDQPVGEHTMFVRKAFAKVQTKQKRTYGLLIGILALCVLGAATYAFVLHQQVKKQKALAEAIFSMR